MQSEEISRERATVSIGSSAFPALVELTQTPLSCRALMRFLPYEGKIIHARWSGEAMWSPLRKIWPDSLMLREECSTRYPKPGQLLLYAGQDSEPEILIAYGATRFASRYGMLAGNPVLTLVERLEELAQIGESLLETGASTLRIEANTQN
jgi:hypothetical protein